LCVEEDEEERAGQAGERHEIETGEEWGDRQFRGWNCAKAKNNQTAAFTIN